MIGGWWWFKCDWICKGQHSVGKILQNCIAPKVPYTLNKKFSKLKLEFNTRNPCMKYIEIIMWWCSLATGYICICSWEFWQCFSEISTSIFYHFFFFLLNLSCHLPKHWPHGGSCAAVLCSSTPEIYSLLTHLYSGVTQSTVCAIPPAMFN